MYERYKDQGVLVYGLHRGEDPDQLANFVEQTGVGFPIVHDGGTYYSFGWAEGVGYPYPRDVVIGPDLRVLSVKNSFDIQETEALIQEHLGR